MGGDISNAMGPNPPLSFAVSYDTYGSNCTPTKGSTLHYDCALDGFNSFLQSTGLNSSRIMYTLQRFNFVYAEVKVYNDVSIR